MPRNKHIAHRSAPQGAALFAGVWAIDPRFPLKARLQNLDQQISTPLAEDDDQYIREMKATNGFTSYVNPDGTEVSSLDREAGELIQPGAIAVIPIHGVMLKSCPDWYQYYGFTSTARATTDISNAAADDRVTSIVLNVYTPGGMVYGAEALSEAVKAAATAKTVTTHVSDLCASAGVFGTAHSTSILLSGRTTEMGSIGTMASVVNDDEFWKEYGIEWIDVYASDSTEKNAAYNEAREGKTAKMVANLDAFNAVFLATVREGRAGKLADPEPLTGAMYVGEAAIAAGLADGYASIEQIIQMARQQADQADNVPQPQNRKQPNAMSVTAKLAAIASAITAFFTNKETPSAEEIAQFNATIKTDGITGATLVTNDVVTAAARVPALEAELATAQQEAQRITAERDQALATATNAQAALATAQAATTEITGALEAIATEHAIEAAEGSTVAQTVLAKAKEWAKLPAATHAGGTRNSDPKTAPKESKSIQAARDAGIKIPEQQA